MDDDDESGPEWLVQAWTISQALTSAVQAKPRRVLRITPVRASNRPVVDKVLWKWGHAPCTSLFELGHPGVEVPAGAKFAFPVGKGISYTEIAHLRDMPLAKAFKIQVLELAEGYIEAAKQVLFFDSRVVCEFSL